MIYLGLSSLTINSQLYIIFGNPNKFPSNAIGIGEILHNSAITSKCLGSNGLLNGMNVVSS
jgi:hypothetical protein